VRRAFVAIGAAAVIAPAGASLLPPTGNADPQTTAWTTRGLRIGAAPKPSALSILATARRSGPLRDLLGTARVRIAAAGDLRDGLRVVGATLLLELATPRRDVAATVPTYVPVAGMGGPYRMVPVDMRASLLRTLLVDVDLQAGRIIAMEPGPGSITTAWNATESEARGEDLAAAQAIYADAATHALRLVRASPGGPAFMPYDGNRGVDARQRDWPVSLVFAGNATVGKVRGALRRIGFVHQGHRRFLAYRAGSALRFVGSRGVKTGCDAASSDLHVRMYTPPAGRFIDPRLGSVVLATVHFDRNDGCGIGPRMYGFSEVAERDVASALARQFHWRVEIDRLALGNGEPLRRDIRDPAHVWLADGRATVVHVP
jgi:hypothetical protein